MERVTGIAGVFLRSSHTQSIQAQHLRETFQQLQRVLRS